MSRSLSKRVRFEVFKRDGFACQYCGRTPPDVVLECDHINPVVEGGSDDADNLITACFDCNRGKSDVPLSSIPESLSDKAARVAEAEEQIAAYSAAMQARRARIEDDIWTVVLALTGETEIRRDRYQSIKVFLERLPRHEVVDAAEVARSRVRSSRSSFLYFCGICWNKIRAREE